MSWKSFSHQAKNPHQLLQSLSMPQYSEMWVVPCNSEYMQANLKHHSTPLSIFHPCHNAIFSLLKNQLSIPHPTKWTTVLFSCMSTELLSRSTSKHDSKRVLVSDDIIEWTAEHWNTARYIIPFCNRVGTLPLLHIYTSNYPVKTSQLQRPSQPTHAPLFHSSIP